MAETKAPTPSALEPIESVVVKKFYAPNNQMMEVGQPYVYQPDTNAVVEERLPYPWPLIRPQDTKLDKQLSEEYFAWKRKKEANINIKADGANDTVLNLAKLLGRLAAQEA